MGNADIAELIHSWSRGFRAQELTAEEIQDRFAELDVSTTDAPQPVRSRILEAQRELDAIRWGMCAAGQRAEIGRVFAELEEFLAKRKEVS
jgi:hypothetical protein